MDPSFVTNAIWHEISVMLRFLWLYVFFIVGFALFFLTAHAFLPSLASTGQLPDRIVKLRPLLYLASFGILAVALVFFVLTSISASWIPDVMDRWWL